jgi:hypothetical protein
VDLFDLTWEIAVVLGATGVLGGAMAEGLAAAGALRLPSWVETRTGAKRGYVRLKNTGHRRFLFRRRPRHAFAADRARRAIDSVWRSDGRRNGQRHNGPQNHFCEASIERVAQRTRDWLWSMFGIVTPFSAEGTRC